MAAFGIVANFRFSRSGRVGEVTLRRLLNLMMSTKVLLNRRPRIKRMLDSNLRSFSLSHCSRVYRAIALLFFWGRAVGDGRPATLTLDICLYLGLDKSWTRVRYCQIVVKSLS